MPEDAYLAAVRESYDTVAADYAAQVSTPDGLDPLSRAMLAAFAETVRTAGGAHWRTWDAAPGT